jgi:peptide chain release factor subunit 1
VPVTRVQEKKVINRFFDEIAQDTGKYCYGVEDTLRALELGAVETLICWEDLDIQRFVLKSTEGDSMTILHLTADQEKSECHKESGVELKVLNKQSLLEWFVDNYKTFGTKLEIITNKIQEGNQFVHGFGGVGGLLRFKVNFDTTQLYTEEYDIDDY